MQPLEKSLRNNLEKTIKDARDIAEEAARVALEQLGVGQPKAYPHLSEDDRKLRRKLRAHGRQLGNGRNAKGEQDIDRLIEEVAYEHWHRMLFARFLAENNLLMYPDPDEPVAVTLVECEDLATDEGAANGWELASRYASKMLPQIFRHNSPIFQLFLPAEYQQTLENLIANLPDEVFTASDALGWVYQFWQTKNKDEVNASGVKIGARELPAVTQLFTEPYMVGFLLDNSLGAWWALRRLSASDQKNASSEEVLRSKAAIKDVSLEYLRFVRKIDGSWVPAAGKFDSWSENLKELKILDPCCGSGHFLVAAFQMLVPMRIALEGLEVNEAVDAVLSENIHGLELDKRCIEIAAFALALNAWKYPGAGGYRLLPELNLACTGLPVNAREDDWVGLAGDNTDLRIALKELYKKFVNSSVLGSLIDPKDSTVKNSLFELKWGEIIHPLMKALESEKDDEIFEMGVTASGMAKACQIMTQWYDLIVTNVPYRSRNDLSKEICEFIDKEYAKSNGNIATVFLERCFKFLKPGGSLAIVILQDWLFQPTYKKLRKKLLTNAVWRLIGRLGPQAFQTPMWDFNVQLLIQSKPTKNFAKNIGLNGRDSLISVFDLSDIRSSMQKSLTIKSIKLNQAGQSNQLNNPDHIVLSEEMDVSSLLSLQRNLVFFDN